RSEPRHHAAHLLSDHATNLGIRSEPSDMHDQGVRWAWKCQKRAAWCKSASNEKGAVLAVTSKSMTVTGSARAATLAGRQQAPQAVSNAAPVAMPTRKKYCTAQGSQAAS